ncbi:MAG: hypothetical protein EOO20_08825, partial [Chryseobacterium sp.]
NITKENFDITTLEWESLEQLYLDYLEYMPSLEPTAVMIFNMIMKADKVHSVRYRIKNPEHLIEKIIRRRIEKPSEVINLNNYKTVVTDLIGVRALHLFKEDWEPVHEYITNQWYTTKAPVINYREGDTEESLKRHKELGCDTFEHPAGYRSVHYILETQPAKDKVFVELQVRTIFEEAWSEIDHVIRYPYDLNNQIFKRYLMTFNRLAGGADEMGSFIAFLKENLLITKATHAQEIVKKDKIIKELQEKIEQSKIDKKDKESIFKTIDSLDLWNNDTSVDNYITLDDTYIQELLFPKGNKLIDEWSTAASIIQSSKKKIDGNNK